MDVARTPPLRGVLGGGCSDRQVFALTECRWDSACPARTKSVTKTSSQMASCPTMARGALTPLSAIQSISRSHRGQSHHAVL